MPHERFFIDQELQEGKEICVTGAELHHLKDVMRLQKGDVLEILNGKGSLASGILEKVAKESATITLTHCQTFLEPKPRLILAQALPRFQKLEWILEKGTELGASTFWLFPGRGSEKETLSANQTRRCALLLQGALKQCGRLFLPTVELKPPLLEWGALAGSLFFGDLEGKPFPHPMTEQNTIILFIGPEKGWEAQEKAHLQTTLKAQPILLNPYTLRAETAAIAGLAQLSYCNTLNPSSPA